MRLRGGNAKPRRRSLKSNVYLSANESPFSLYNRITICIPLNVAIRPIETRLFYWPINRISFAWPFIVSITESRNFESRAGFALVSILDNVINYFARNSFWELRSSFNGASISPRLCETLISNALFNPHGKFSPIVTFRSRSG